MVRAVTQARGVEGASAPLRNKPLDDDDRRLSSWHTATLAPVLALISCVLFSVNGELLQFLQGHISTGSHVSPMLNLIACHLGGLFFAPHFLFRKGPNGSALHSTSQGNCMNVQAGALLLAILVMGYNYAWLLSARFLAVGLTNAIFQTSVAFVYLCGVTVFRDTPFAPAQIVGVVLCLGGSALASGVGGGAPASRGIWLGVFLAMCASVGCTLYQVLFKYLFGHLKNDARFLAQVGAWVSVWHVVAIFPIAVLAHALGFETMEFPHGRFAVWGTLTSACIASTVNALYICIVMWGSSMLLPCASLFSVPFMVGLDMMLHAITPTRFELCGHIMVVMSVVLILDLHKALARNLQPDFAMSEKLKQCSPTQGSFEAKEEKIGVTEVNP